MKIKSEAVILGQTIHKLIELGIPDDGSSYLIKDLRALMVRINGIKAGGNRGFDGQYFWGYIDEEAEVERKYQQAKKELAS